MKSENGQPITEELQISFFLELFCNWLFVFCCHRISPLDVAILHPGNTHALIDKFCNYVLGKTSFREWIYGNWSPYIQSPWKIHSSNGDRQYKIGQKENVCLACSYVFSVRNGQADRGTNAPLYLVSMIYTTTTRDGHV